MPPQASYANYPNTERTSAPAPSPFRWNGPYGRGAMQQRRALRREQAEERNARTAPARRRAARR